MHSGVAGGSRLDEGEIPARCLSTAGETASLKSELSYKISELEVKLRAEIKESVGGVRTELAGLAARIDKLEATMQERFRWQWWPNGVMVAMLIGLYFR